VCFHGLWQFELLHDRPRDCKLLLQGHNERCLVSPCVKNAQQVWLGQQEDRWRSCRAWRGIEVWPPPAPARRGSDHTRRSDNQAPRQSQSLRMRHGPSWQWRSFAAHCQCRRVRLSLQADRASARAGQQIRWLECTQRVRGGAPRLRGGAGSSSGALGRAEVRGVVRVVPR
jgi:hypothetical protein